MEFHTPRRISSTDKLFSAEGQRTSQNTERLENEVIPGVLPEVPKYYNRLIFDKNKLGGADWPRYLKEQMTLQKVETTFFIKQNEICENEEAFTLERRNKEIEDSKPKNFQ